MFGSVIRKLSWQYDIRLTVTKKIHTYFMFSILCFEFITAQKMSEKIGRKLRFWSHLLKKFLMENFIFCAVYLFLFLSSKNHKLFKNCKIFAMHQWLILLCFMCCIITSEFSGKIMTTTINSYNKNLFEYC